MACSIESRLPILDFRLVETIFQIAAISRIKNGQLKYLLRQTVKYTLPKRIMSRRDKIGFNSPLALWFNDKRVIRPLCILTSNKLKASEGFLRPDITKKIITEHQCPSRDYSDFIWKALNVELWLRVFDKWLTY
jgi:asparagine synthase (glutamine-hydrolysing)